MSRNTKITICITLVTIFVITVLSLSTINRMKIKDNSKINIVATTFSCYDFARQIAGDKANVTLLINPGSDEHSYEPSASDLIKIKNADIFIYIGGEIEQWADKVLESNTVDTNKTKLIKVTECIDLIEETDVDGAEIEEEEDGAFDGHIWSSPDNAIKMMDYLCKEICKLDEDNIEYYQTNTKNYSDKIKDVQQKIANIVNEKKRDRLIFGDKMPMQYFLNEFDLKVSAAFNGCSTEAEPSAKTVTYLINKVKEEEIPVVLYIELSTGKTAKSIANETSAQAMQIQTLHNVSKDDFNNGETYVSLMNRNLDVLKVALQ